MAQFNNDFAMAGGGTPGIRHQVAVLCDGLLENEPTFSVVDLRFLNPPLNREERDALVHAVVAPQNTCIRKLDLRGSFRNLPPHEVESFVERVLGTNHPSLRELDLSCNRFDEHHATALGRAVRTNTTLREIGLDHNQFGPRGGQILAEEGFRHNKTLERVDLDGCELGTSGSLHVARALSENPSLKVLSLCANDAGGNNNGVPDRSDSRSLFRCLFVDCNKLERLRLVSNRIDDEDCTDIADALKRNTNLQRLSLGENRISNVGAARIADALRYANYTIRNIDLDRQFEGRLFGARHQPAPVGADGQALSLSRRQQGEVIRLCEANRTVYGRKFQRLKSSYLVSEPLPGSRRSFLPLFTLPNKVWPHAIAMVSQKPDLIQEIIKTKIPELFPTSTGEVPEQEPAFNFQTNFRKRIREVAPASWATCGYPDAWAAAAATTAAAPMDATTGSNKRRRTALVVSPPKRYQHQDNFAAAMAVQEALDPLYGELVRSLVEHAGDGGARDADVADVRDGMQKLIRRQKGRRKANLKPAPPSVPAAAASTKVPGAPRKRKRSAKTETAKAAILEVAGKGKNIQAASAPSVAAAVVCRRSTRIRKMRKP